MPVTPPDVFDLVRAGCSHVASCSTWVTIDHALVDGYAATLIQARPPAGQAAPATEAPDPWAAPTTAGDEARAALVVALDAINFGSGYHPHVAKLPGLSGARTMAARLRTWADDQGGVRASVLASLERTDVHRIFGQPEHDELVELMGLFTTALNELGRTVVDDHDGSFVSLVEAADSSGARLVDRLASLPTYADRSTYRGVDVPFLKRAQLTVADLHRAFGGSGLGAFTDVDRLTAFADNLVPHVLRVDGVLVLDPELELAIGRGELLVHGDEPEVELRACGVHAVELLRVATARAGGDLDSAAIDQLLWARGAGARYKSIPRPRARTSAY